MENGISVRFSGDICVAISANPSSRWISCFFLFQRWPNVTRRGWVKVRTYVTLWWCLNETIIKLLSERVFNSFNFRRLEVFSVCILCMKIRPRLIVYVERSMVFLVALVSFICDSPYTIFSIIWIVVVLSVFLTQNDRRLVSFLCVFNVFWCHHGIIRLSH